MFIIKFHKNPLIGSKAYKNKEENLKMPISGKIWNTSY
jgi:hypothetical protein